MLQHVESGVVWRTETGELTKEGKEAAIWSEYGPDTPERKFASLTWGFIYFVEAVGVDRIKIGWTERSLHGRIAQLDTACPVPLKPIAFMIGTLYIEKRIHEIWKHLRRKGEWFEAHPDLRAVIAMDARDWPTDGRDPPLPYREWRGLRTHT